MRGSTIVLFALALCAAPLAPSFAQGDESGGVCVGPDQPPGLVDVALGLNVLDCDLLGAPLELGAGASVLLPAPGDFVGMSADTSDGTSRTYIVSTAADGTVTASIEYQDVSMIDPALAAIIADQSSAAVELAELNEDVSVQPLAYSRCTDTSSAATGYKWYTSGTISVWVNGTDRRPSNISSAAFSSVASTVLNRWKTGADGCGLSGSPTGLNLANAGNTTRDANMTNGTTSCGSRDNYNVIDWGNLPGTTYGYTCWWGSGMQTTEFDTRMDSSSRSWVTTTTGCSGAYYLAAGMMHEVGHGVGLSHAIERGGSDLTMSPTLAQCNSSTQYLGLGDFNRLMSLY